MNPLPTTPEQVKEELQSLAGHGPAAPILIRLFEIGLKCGKPLPVAYERVLRRYLKFIERSKEYDGSEHVAEAHRTWR